jgi:hypothetical protein
MFIKIEYVSGEMINGMTIIKEVPGILRSNGISRSAEFKCSCGNIFIQEIKNIKRRKRIICLCNTITGEKKKEFKRHGFTGTRIYSSYRAMLSRCYYKPAKVYQYYGAKGITVCDEWKNDFIAFLKWANDNGFDDKLEIDRIDSRGNYEPSNCQWITHTENVRKRILIKK